jgi:hypothetical protein
MNKLAALLLVAISVLPVRAEETNYRVVDDIRIYLGVIPAAVVRGKHPAAHPEGSMHGGAPSGADEYHVLIALFNARTGERISNARVSAHVSQAGLGGEQKTLAPMKIADTTTYGNFFRMRGPGLFRINVSVHIPGMRRDIDVAFQHKHQ